MTIAPDRPATWTEPPVGTEALIREARRRQRRRWTIIGVIVITLTATAVVVLDGPGSGSPAKSTAASGHPTPFVIPSAKQLHDETLGNYFPTSAADFTAGLLFASLVNALTVKREAECLTSAGFPSSIQVVAPGDGQADNTEFPPASRIASSGLNAGSQQGGSAALIRTGPWRTGLTRRQFAEATSRCNASAVAIYAPLNSGTPKALQVAWMSSVIPQVDTSPAFKGALVGWSACMRSGGVDVSTLDQFFDYADHQQGRGRSIVGIGRLFGRCMGPAEALRVHLRQAARSSFILEHSAEVSALTTLVNRTVR